MHSSTEQLTALLDREKIRDCIARLARGEDRRDARLVSRSFWPDATIDIGIFAGSFDEYLAWVVPGSPSIPVTQHMLGQTVIECSGDTAFTETHVTAYHRVGAEEGDRDTVIGGRYLDRMDKRGAYWRIGQRTMLYDWYQDVGRSADWSQGLMGLPFSADHYTGRSVGDYSETFYGKGAEWLR
ncbi:nuclear transport factor 2 family protein [Mycolicibacterium moriokaense]|uniref:SnoaL-like protein n=1 Tax=Mycolicibacterium moriokaense TaxID=39691 RepID=A0A318HIW3_9MYCO|nr:nuclear transport factor 2 family protein [Mycolicibacterium moriokaense]PXX07001.1 SnoaL-like protein [Mycolicibacterium moriokaense]